MHVFQRVMACSVAALLAAASAAGAAQLQQGTIQGTVVDPDGRPVSEISVTLVDELGQPVMSVMAAANGQYRFANVAPGTYGLSAAREPLRAAVEAVQVTGALPVTVDLRLSAVLAEQITVRAEEPAATKTEITLAGETIRRAPARLRSRGLQDAIATTPGWAGEDNGLLHVRGVDDGFLFVIDGVPVYERIDGLFGVAPDPAMIDSVNVMTGYIPPEFGFKSGGVIEVRSATGAAGAWTGSADAGGGADATRDVSAVGGGPLGSRAALTLGIAGQRSSRFLDPVHPDNLHNDGGALSGGGQFGWTVSPSSTLTVVFGAARSAFDVPHGEEQEEADQDQRQRIGQQWQTASWQRAWTSSVVSQVAGYHRDGTSRLMGSGNDTPLFTDADRQLRRVGVLGSVTRDLGSHVLKAGGEAARLSLHEHLFFAVTDEDEAEEADLSEAAIEHDLDDPFDFHETAAPTLFSLYLQDSFRAAARLTIDVGLRADWSRMLDSAFQASPRAGAAYHWPSTQTTVRASAGRFFQPPQPENLLVASSPEAHALSPFAGDGEGGAAVHPERQTAVEAGIDQALGGGLRLDAAYWRRWVRNAADPNVFFGTTIIFPNSTDSGRASGVDVRLEMPRRAGWSGYISYTNAHVVWFGPINGGLFLEDEVIEIGPGTAFTPDHDQRHSGSFGLTYDHVRRGTWVSLTGLYASGTPLEVEEDDVDALRARPGAALVDFDRGRVRARTLIDVQVGQRLYRGPRIDLSARVSVLNLANRAYAFNFGNPFSGTHFGAGRTVTASVRAAFR
jgi:outer membrane receptor for ferrienterochelin and colicin